MSILLLLSCGGAPLDTATTIIEPEACVDLALTLTQEWQKADLPQRGDPSGTQPGGALGDLDGDGDLDLLLAYGGGATVFEGDGTGALTLSNTWLLDGALLPPAVSVALADLDGDGDLDGWLGSGWDVADRLLWNQGDRTFTGTPLAGSEATPGTGSFFDADGDGDLDLFVSGFVDFLDLFEVTGGTQVGEGTALWINDGGTFVDRTDWLPAETAPAICFQGTVLDADLDGDLDLYMGNDIGAAVPPNLLLLNDGTGRFALAEDCRCELAMASMGSGMGDANHDGVSDIFISDFGSPELLMGMGDGTFYQGTAAAGALIPETDDHATGWGTTFVDVNQDRCMDMVILYGECCSSSEEFVDSPAQYDQLLLGDCAGGFTREEPFHPGFENTERSRSVVIGDLNADNRPDIVVIGKHFVKVWLGDGGCSPGISLALNAGAGNRQGIGAKVTVEAGGVRTTQWMLTDTASSSSEHRLYFGLGGYPSADRVTVEWPGGGRSVLEDVVAGSRLVVER
jgi:hypothetical protein